MNTGRYDRTACSIFCVSLRTMVLARPAASSEHAHRRGSDSRSPRAVPCCSVLCFVCGHFSTWRAVTYIQYAGARAREGANDSRLPVLLQRPTMDGCTCKSPCILSFHPCIYARTITANEFVCLEVALFVLLSRKVEVSTAPCTTKKKTHDTAIHHCSTVQHSCMDSL